MFNWKQAVCAGFLVAALSVPSSAAAQGVAQPPQAGVQVGQAVVTGAEWSFSGTLQGASGPWGSATLTNTNCTTPYRPGTAQAGAAIFTAALNPALGPSGQATLQPYVGSAAQRQIQVTADADGVSIDVTASLSNVEPSLIGTTLSVWLTLGQLPPMLAQLNVDAQLVAAKGYDVTGIATASAGPSTLVAISGTGASEQQWVFFFLGSSYLGTDTGTPSTTSLQLVGSPGSSEINVQYSDPNGGDPVTITYSWDGASLNPSGTPPGH